MNRVLAILSFFIFSVSLLAQTGGEDARKAFLKRSNAESGTWRYAKQQEYGDFLKRTWVRTEESAPVADPFGRGNKSAGLPKLKPVVRVLPDITLESISEDDVAVAWSNLSVSANSLLEDCLAIRKQNQLSDWAYLQLADSLANKATKGRENERQLLLGFLLGKSGYKVRFGRSGGQLTCLYGVEQIIYARPYFVEGRTRYYRGRPGEGSLSISDAVPEGKRPIDLRLKRAPDIHTGPVRQKHISSAGIELDFRIPQGLLDFYAAYPHTEMYVKADAPVSASMHNTLYPALRMAIDGKGQVEAAGILLQFVQGLMNYQTDDERWGFEKWNFPEESLWYQCGDCDDNAILFARLVRDLMDLDVLLVDCEVNGSPHATTAVRFTEPIEGDTLSYEGRTYWCCEPSARFSKVGERCWDSYVVKNVDRVR